jgi:primary-amine oxidase
VIGFVFMTIFSTYAASASAHGGGEEDFIELEAAVEDFGAEIKKSFWFTFNNTFYITKDDTTIKLKVGSDQAIVNDETVTLEVPVFEKDSKYYVSHHFINEVFPQPESTVQVEDSFHPLDPLTPEEIEQVLEVLKKEDVYNEYLRFTEISIKLPEKEAVWDWVFSEEKEESFVREAELIALDNNTVIEGIVDLTNDKLVSWEVIEGAQGMIILDDFETAQSAIENSAEFAEALKKRGIDDPTKVVTTPLTVGYFAGEDKLEEDASLLKVVSYLDVGDGNYWAHPIENLVAVVDLKKGEVIKVEDEGVIPVPLKPTPYDGRGFSEKVDVKPLETVESEGKNYQVIGNNISWHNWDFHMRLDTRVGPVFSTVTFDDQGTKRKIMYEGSLGGMIVPYGDPDVGWYFKSYLDSGEYGMGTLTSPLNVGTDVPNNAQLLEATIADNSGNPYTIPNAVAVFERYAGPEYRHDEMFVGSESRERRELVVRWISTIGNYDYIFDWVFLQNGTIKIDIGASGIEAVKGVVTETMQDETAEEDTRYGTLIDHHIVGTTHQHIYNFRLDMDVDGVENSFMEINPQAAENIAGGPRKSVMVTEEKIVPNVHEAIQNFDPSTIRLITNENKLNKVGNPVSYQVIPFAGGTHPIAKGALFTEDDWLIQRVNFMDKQIWITNYNPEERYPEGKYPNRNKEDTGLKAFTEENASIENTDNVLWLTTGATHVARAEEWPMMPTEWVHVMLKPWNFFDQTPTLDLPELETNE